MAAKLAVLAKTGPRIKSKGVVDLETLSGRMSKNTTYNPEEIYSIMRLGIRETMAALEAGESVKYDDLLTIALSMKVGGKVKMGIRADRGATGDLNNPRLWTADKVSNHGNMYKTVDELLDNWNIEHPDDPVET